MNLFIILLVFYFIKKIRHKYYLKKKKIKQLKKIKYEQNLKKISNNLLYFNIISIKNSLNIKKLNNNTLYALTTENENEITIKLPNKLSCKNIGCVIYFKNFSALNVIIETLLFIYNTNQYDKINKYIIRPFSFIMVVVYDNEHYIIMKLNC